MKRDTEGRYHFVYKTTCATNGKFYIGKHSTRILEDGYLGSGKHFRSSLKLYGKENFTREVLQFFECAQEAKDHEKFLITHEMRLDPMCMNIAPGGGGGFIDEEHRKKATSAGLTAQWSSKEYRESHSTRVSKRIKQTFAEGKLRHDGFRGKKHSEETLIKMRKPKNAGEANSQYGTIWITNGTSTLKVKTKDLSEYLEKGYSRGRKTVAS